MAGISGGGTGNRGLVLAGVQFFFTLGWTTYVVMLPGLLATAGIAASWLPFILMVDQLIFAAMDIALGAAADRMQAAYRRMARWLLVLASVSALAFMLLPLAAGVAPALLLAVLLIWVVSASVVRAPTLILLAKQAKAAQRPGLVIGYTAGIALAMAMSPFLGLGLKGVSPGLPFALAALTLLAAVVVLVRTLDGAGQSDAVLESTQPAPLPACLPLFVALALGGLGFQLHAFVNAGALYGLHAGKEDLPWLLPLLWVGFFAMLVAVGPLVRRFSAMPVAICGLLMTGLGSYLSTEAASLIHLVVLQLLTGAGWALAFAGLMEQASAAGTRGAEGGFMGSFFAVTALSAFARIAMVAFWMAEWKGVQFLLPALLLVLAAVVALPQQVLLKLTVNRKN